MDSYLLRWEEMELKIKFDVHPTLDNGIYQI